MDDRPLAIQCIYIDYEQTVLNIKAVLQAADPSLNMTGSCEGT